MGKTKTLLARLAAAAAGGTLALTGAAPAVAAQDEVIRLKEDHRNVTAEDFRPHQCDEPFDELKENEDGWHFVLTQFTGDLEDVEFRLTFENTDGNPEELTVGADGLVLRGQVVHLWLITAAGWTLVDGEASAPGDALGANSQFNLSHTCAGEADDEKPEPTPTPTRPEPTPEPTPTKPGEEPTPRPTQPGENGEGGEQPGDDEEGLPVTGMQVSGLVALGAGLLAAGAAAMLAVRRRRSAADLTEG